MTGIELLQMIKNNEVEELWKKLELKYYMED